MIVSRHLGLWIDSFNRFKPDFLCRYCQYHINWTWFVGMKLFAKENVALPKVTTRCTRTWVCFTSCVSDLYHRLFLYFFRYLLERVKLINSWEFYPQTLREWRRDTFTFPPPSFCVAPVGDVETFCTSSPSVSTAAWITDGSSGLCKIGIWWQQHLNKEAEMCVVIDRIVFFYYFLYISCNTI